MTAKTTAWALLAVCTLNIKQASGDSCCVYWPVGLFAKSISDISYFSDITVPSRPKRLWWGDLCVARPSLAEAASCTFISGKQDACFFGWLCVPFALILATSLLWLILYDTIFLHFWIGLLELSETVLAPVPKKWCEPCSIIVERRGFYYREIQTLVIFHDSLHDWMSSSMNFQSLSCTCSPDGTFPKFVGFISHIFLMMMMMWGHWLT